MQKIAIIDNGIDAKKIVMDNKMQTINFVSQTSPGSHGTICALIIKQYLPEVQFVDLKVLHGNEGNADRLFDALQWCLYNDVTIINISCGTEQLKQKIRIRQLINRLVKKGIVVIAAGSNSGLKSYPADLRGVIGVKTKPWLFVKDFYTINNNCFEKGINIIASSQHDCFLLDKYTPLCNSYAAPCITACVAKYLDEYDRNSSISRYEYINMRLQQDSIRPYREISTS